MGEGCIKIPAIRPGIYVKARVSKPTSFEKRGRYGLCCKTSTARNYEEHGFLNFFAVMNDFYFGFKHETSKLL